MKKKCMAILTAFTMACSLAACGGSSAPTAPAEETEIQVFIAASLNTVMQEVAAAYNKQHPEVKITYNADSSGTLLTQIEEGYACDVFFSAAQKQMDKLEKGINSLLRAPVPMLSTIRSLSSPARIRARRSPVLLILQMPPASLSPTALCRSDVTRALP